MCNNRGGRFFFLFFLLLFFFFLSTISRPFDFHGNERFPSKYRIDRRPTKREKERERGREPIFSRGTMGTTSVTANGTFRVQTFRSFTSSTCTTTVKTSIVSPTTDFLRIIPRATAMVTASNLPAGSPFIVGDGIRF